MCEKDTLRYEAALSGLCAASRADHSPRPLAATSIAHRQRHNLKDRSRGRRKQSNRMFASYVAASTYLEPSSAHKQDHIRSWTNDAMARVHFAPSTEDLRDEQTGASPEQGEELFDLSTVDDKHTGDDIVAHGPGAVEDEPLLNGGTVEEGDEHGYGRRIPDDEDLVRREGGSSLSAIANMLNGP